MLGQTGVNLVEIKKAYDAATAAQRGDVVPVVVSVFEDRSFALRLKTPPTAFLIKKALGDKVRRGPGTRSPAKSRRTSCARSPSASCRT